MQGSDCVVHNVRLSRRLLDFYKARASDLRYDGVGPLIREALQFYAERILPFMEA